MLTTASDTSMVSLVTVMVLATSFILKATKIAVPLMVPSITPRCSEGITSLSGSGTAVAPSRRIFSRSIAVALTRSFLPLKSDSRRIAFLAA